MTKDGMTVTNSREDKARQKAAKAEYERLIQEGQIHDPGEGSAFDDPSNDDFLAENGDFWPPYFNQDS